MVIDWENTQLRITLTGRTVWPTGQKFEWRTDIPDHDLWFGVRGSGKMVGKSNKTVPLSAGSCLWLTPGQVYSVWQEPEDPLDNYWVHFELYDQNGRLRPYDQPTPPEVLDAGDGVIVGSIMRRILELIPFYTPENAHQFPPEHRQIANQLMRGLVMDLDHASDTRGPGKLSGTLRHHHEVVMRAVVEIQDRIGGRYTVGELADIAGYSPEHFSRVFRSVMGQPPEEFLIRTRIEHAKGLLSNSPMSISEIAHALGYSKPSFFSVQFRQRTGMSPRQYREMRSQMAQ